MKYRLYRGTKNITPAQAKDIYLSTEAGFLHGRGMYLAFDKAMAEQYILGKDLKWSLLCSYSVEVLKSLYIKNKQLEVPKEDESLYNIEHLISTIDDLLKENFKNQKIKTIKDYPGFNEVSSENKDKIFKEIMDFNTEQQNTNEGKLLLEKEKQLIDLKEKAKIERDSLLNEYEAIIDEETGMIILKTDKLDLELLEFDLILPTSEESKSLFESLKLGSLEDVKIKDIPGEMADFVTQELLKIKNP